jgi:hypothetical protein
MLTPGTRLKLQAILRRIAHSHPVSLSERIYVQKFADRDRTVSSWLRRARRMQNPGHEGGVDHLLNALDLGDVDPGGRNHHSPNDDLGDWFSGAPDWLRRS